MIDPRTIVIALPPEVRPLSEEEQVFQRIKDYDARAFGPKPNKNDRAVTLILLCLTEGVVTKPGIFRALMRFGIKREHIGNMLKYNDVQHTPAGLWKHDCNGVYQSIP